MSEMVERVARAIYETHCANHVPPIRSTWDADAQGRAVALLDARAAIDAMREPTEAMLKASPVVGTGINEKGAWCVNTEPAQIVWAAMVGAALEPDKP